MLLGKLGLNKSICEICSELQSKMADLGRSLPNLAFPPKLILGALMHAEELIAQQNADTPSSQYGIIEAFIVKWIGLELSFGIGSRALALL